MGVSYFGEAHVETLMYGLFTTRTYITLAGIMQFWE